MIKTGAEIIDIDHLVPSMSDFSAMLSSNQVFSGKADPVSVIQDGSEKKIKDVVACDFIQAGKRCIISAGCEITPGTSVANMHAFKKAAAAVK
jgi:uroporphyrinogen-III decarboxylase